MDEINAELLALTNFHHFLLEVLLAQSYAASPAGSDALAGLRSGVLDRIERRATFRPGEAPTTSEDIENAAEVMARQVLLARRFFDRTEARREEIQTQLARMGRRDNPPL
ncbi:MAG: hypothetical protein RIS35_2895 [Pseudomonadota bacterium]